MQFEKQEYQQECVDNIIEVLRDFDFENPRAENLKSCLQDFYKNKPQPVMDINENLNANNLNLDILMETGTGKTFTYLNAIFALHKEYNQKKFIIFVPRKAILESVRQNINLTKQYFYNEFGIYLKEYYYSSEKSLDSIISHYINNADELSVLILTNSAIDKKGNILNRANERTMFYDNATTLDSIIALNPICIIDEPHLLKGAQFSATFRKFKNIYFRFGATFPQNNTNNDENKKSQDISNMIYCLDSKSAFEKYLVKQIAVHTITSQTAMPKLRDFRVHDRKAKFSYFVNNFEYEKIVNFDDDLGTLLHYSHWIGVSIVNAKNDTLYLINGDKVQKSSSSYILDDNKIELLMQKAIDLHFEKEERLFKQGIKALCLFFIPNISDFRERGVQDFKNCQDFLSHSLGDSLENSLGANLKESLNDSSRPEPHVAHIKSEARIKKIFERLYIQKRNEILQTRLSREYRAYLQKDFDDNNNLCVAQGYFSGDKGSIEEKEATGVNLILKEKEKLLSFESSLRFIFSVWALQEGWDNPNIFTLVKLASSSSNTSRHQQVGRGLRLCVNQHGKRIDFKHENENDEKFYEKNALDVLVSDEEVEFIAKLQNEIIENSFSDDVITKSSWQKNGISNTQINRIFKKLQDSNCGKILDNGNFHLYKTPDENIKNDLKNIVGDNKMLMLENMLTKKKKINKNKYVRNANECEKYVKIRPNQARKFKKLWNTINLQVQVEYENIKEKKLIKEIARSFNGDSIDINVHKSTIKKEIYDVKTNKITQVSENTIATIKHNQNDIMHNLMSFVKNERLLPLNMILKIYKKLDKAKFNRNPSQSLKELRDIIKNKIHKKLVKSVKYKFIKDNIKDNELYDKNGKIKNIRPHTLGDDKSEDKKAQEKYLYDEIIFDSQIEQESITEEIGEIENYKIKVFAKLPKFSIPIPPYDRHYEPDFAYLLENDENKKIFFICETKGYNRYDDISKDEKTKIKYAKRFFESLQQEMSDKVQISFKTRKNGERLQDLISDIILPQ